MCFGAVQPVFVRRVAVVSPAAFSVNTGRLWITSSICYAYLTFLYHLKGKYWLLNICLIHAGHVHWTCLEYKELSVACIRIRATLFISEGSFFITTAPDKQNSNRAVCNV